MSNRLAISPPIIDRETSERGRENGAMALARSAAIWIGAAALLAALGLASRAGYLWFLTPCKGNTGCMRSASTSLMDSSAMVIVGTALMVLGRRPPETK